MKALYAFAEWLSAHVHRDSRHRLPPGLRLNIHSRSDAHSVRLAELLMDELIEMCPLLREQAARGEIGYGVNYRFRFPNGKPKTLDFAVGIPLLREVPPNGQHIRRLRNRGSKNGVISDSDRFTRLLIACELKSVLTEHSKSQPRVFDELNGSHAIVHAGSRDTIAAGLTLINIAPTFISPLRQARDRAIIVSQHHQPEDAANMVAHLRGLPRRDTGNPIGFDAYCSFVMDIDNQGRALLWTDAPSPQSGEPDHFDRFLAAVCRSYTQQFADLDHLPEPKGLSVEEALRELSRQYPGLLTETGQLAIDADLAGAPELRTILQAIELQVQSEGNA